MKSKKNQVNFRFRSTERSKGVGDDDEGRIAGRTAMTVFRRVVGNFGTLMEDPTLLKVICSSSRIFPAIRLDSFDPGLQLNRYSPIENVTYCRFEVRKGFLFCLAL